MLRVNTLNLNGIIYNFIDDNQPEGLHDATLSFERDQLYVGMDLEIQTEISIYCHSYKEIIDQAYNERGIDNEAIFEIDYICSGQKPLPFLFKVDWRSYKSNTTSTTFKLIAKSEFTEYKEIDDNEVELNNANLLDVYVRKIPLRYLRNATNFRVDDYDTDGNIKNNSITTSNARFVKIFILPTSDTSINEFEESQNITTNTFSFEKTFNYTALGNPTITTTQIGIPTEKCFLWDANLTQFTSGNIGISNIEPEPILENKMGNGVLEIEDIGGDSFRIENEDGNFRFRFETAFYESILVIGSRYDNPRMAISALLLQRPITFNQVANQIGNGFVSFDVGNGAQINTQKISIPLKEGEKVWHQYAIVAEGLLTAIPGTMLFYDFSFNYTKGKFRTNRQLNAEFKAETYQLNNSNDVNEVTHNKTKMFKLEDEAFNIFGISGNLFSNNLEFNDLYFTTGEQVRNKVEQRPVKLKPKSFFTDLEAFLPIGLGLEYEPTSNNYKLFLKEHKDLYQDTVYKVYDLVDEIDINVGTIGYNDIEIGSEQFKDTELSKHKRNNYNVQTSKYRSKWSKITKFILDPYIWLRASKEGTDNDKKEFDDNVFIMSAKSIGGKITSLSSTSGYAPDNVTESSGMSTWLNRRYSTVYNLLRKVNQWRESIFYDKPELYTNSIHDNELEITGSNYLDSIATPQDMSLVRSVIEAHSPNRKFENTIIKFSTPMNENQFFELTKNWYSIIGVTDGNKTYYGNVISCTLSEGVAEFTLIKRII